MGAAELAAKMRFGWATRWRRRHILAAETSMAAIQKITVEVSSDLLQQARVATGAGVTETVREGLQALVSQRAQLGLLKLGGRVKVALDLDTLREDR